MDSLIFKPGQAFLASDSRVPPWTVVFEDEGTAAYFYACDRGHAHMEDSILDAVLVYNVSKLGEPERDYLAAVEWSADGTRAALYLDGNAQAIFDFAAHRGYSRTNFPNFQDGSNALWPRASHEWSDAMLEAFESEIYNTRD